MLRLLSRQHKRKVDETEIHLLFEVGFWFHSMHDPQSQARVYETAVPYLVASDPSEKEAATYVM